MKRTILAATLFATALLATGCASVEKTLICNQAEHDAIVAENARLVERRKTIDSYLNGGPIPWESQSMTTREHLESAYAASYNRAVDELERRSNTFNRLCVKKAT